MNMDVREAFCCACSGEDIDMAEDEQTRVSCPPTITLFIFFFSSLSLLRIPFCPLACLCCSVWQMSFSQSTQSSRKLCWSILKYSRASTRGGQPDVIDDKLDLPIDWQGGFRFLFLLTSASLGLLLRAICTYCCTLLLSP